MIQWTDSHFRTFLRSIATHPLLYTEMIMDNALVGQHYYHANDLTRLEPWLVAGRVEEPLAFQLGGGGIDGADPTMPLTCPPTVTDNVNHSAIQTLTTAAELVLQYHPTLTELNINSGCPSSKALRGGFGADLMRVSSHDHTRAAVNAVVRAVGSKTNVTVKCRIGVVAGKGDEMDNRTSYKSLCQYVAGMKQVGRVASKNKQRCEGWVAWRWASL